MDSQTEDAVGGYAQFNASGSFIVRITDTRYLPAEVTQLLKNGDLAFQYGDTKLFDDDTAIGTIEWEIDEDGIELSFDSDESSRVEEEKP